MGLSKCIFSESQDASCVAGTFRYLSPEQLDLQLTFKIDIWQFGCVLMQFATGIRPFDKNTDNEAMIKIIRGTTPLDDLLTTAKAA